MRETSEVRLQQKLKPKILHYMFQVHAFRIACDSNDK